MDPDRGDQKTYSGSATSVNGKKLTYYYLDFLGLHLGEPDPELPDTSLEAASPAHRPLQQEAATWPAVMAFLTAVVLPI
jgi:hypothetical protein